MPQHKKVAVVTGGGRGIGRAICERLAREGAAVAAWDLNAEAAQETAAIITNAGGTAISCPTASVPANCSTILSSGASVRTSA